MDVQAVQRSLLHDLWKHLRLPFQLTLAPIFLWGYALSGAPVRWDMLPSFIAFHLLLYPGITLYNSYYDRDEGPVGGLEHPPDWHPSLLPLGWALQAAGFVLACLQSPAFLSLYVSFMVLSILYSHPSTRWKATPALSALVVCGGQGGLGFLAGWAAGTGELRSALGAVCLLSAAAAAMTTFAMYPLTQLYQMEEDARRGDRTLCLVLGASRALKLSEASLLLAGAAGVTVTVLRFSWLDGMLLAAAFGLLACLVERLRRQYASLSMREAFRWVLLCQYAAAAAFTLFIGARLARWL
jgi:4-hydroxybenzoate polyprenyltransferase